jgi:N-acetylglucosamine-6-sulfatase
VTTATVSPTRRPRRRGPLSLLVALAALGLLASVPVVAAERPAAAADGERPNIILVTTDDMALTDLRWMPQTRKLIEGAGVEVKQFISNHPVCCPARAEIMTGQYGHNNGVHHNKGLSGGFAALRQKDQNIGRWLQDAGYQTAFVGKHVNGWESMPYNQPGWTQFNPIWKNIPSTSPCGRGGARAVTPARTPPT